MHASTARLRATIPFLTVAAAAIVAYANSFTVPFVMDDELNIVLAPGVHALELSPAALAPAVGGFPAGRWLAHLSFAVNHALGGVHTSGYHVVNLAFHVASGCLVLLLAREVLARASGLGPDGQRRAALLTALLFVVHPIQTQAVTYVVQRMTSMGAFFGLLSLLLWVRWRAAPGTRVSLLLASALAAYLAFACKESYAVLPVLALLLDALLFPGLWDRARRRPAIALAVTVAFLGAALYLASRYSSVIASEAPRYGVTVGERLLTQPRVLWLYLSLLALPLPGRLHLDYTAWAPSTGWLDPPSTFLAAAGLAGLLVLAVAARRRAPLFAFATAWFLAALSIEQTVLPVHFAFEHRMYLPSFGWFLLAAWGLERSLRRAPVAPALVSAPIVAALVLGTLWRNAEWNDPARLHADAAGDGPRSAGQLIALGRVLGERGQLEEAERTLRRAIDLEPDHPVAFMNLGAVMAERGKPAEALALYRQAIALNPKLIQAWHGLALTLYRDGRIEEAERAAREGLAANPASALLRVPIAACRERRGDLEGARRVLEAALGLDPGLWIGWSGLAHVLLAEGRAAEALPAAQRYAAAFPGDARAHALVGSVLVALGRDREARAALERASSLDPGDEDVRRALSALSSDGGSKEP